MHNLKISDNDSLKAINSIVKLTTLNESVEVVLQRVVEKFYTLLKKADVVAVKLIINESEYRNSDYIDSENVDKITLNQSETDLDILEIYYKNSTTNSSDINNFLTGATSVLTGYISKNRLNNLYHINKERVKELKSIQLTNLILEKSSTINDSLQEICNLIPEAWQYTEHTAARILFNDQAFTSCNFEPTKWILKKSFETPDREKGSIEVYYLKEFTEADLGPFLKEEHSLLDILTSIISGTVSQKSLQNLIKRNTERLKELEGINRTSQIISECKPVDKTMFEIISILRSSWQYPEFTGVKIHYEGCDYTSANFNESSWSQIENFITIDNNKGFIQVVYLKEFPFEYEGPFLKEERDLLINIGKLISAYFNNNKGREIFRTTVHKKRVIENPEDYKKTFMTNKRPLQQFFNQRVLDKYIYLDMMKYKVKEILFVATFYDAFILENEDGFFERFMGEIYQYSLFSLPRITGVTTTEEALEMLDSKSFDLVILMVGLDKEAPVILSEKIKEKSPSLPIYVLSNQKKNIKHFEQKLATSKTLDNLFYWNGDSEILFSIVKSIEDRANVANDTEVGLVRVILVVEDSCLYYSKYLQILYRIVFDQVQRLLPEVEKNELDKICKMRARPKVLLAKNYEDAMHLFNKYKDYLLCVISDIEYDHGGGIDKSAGLDFIKYVKSNMMKLPIILQSSNGKNRTKADELDAFFINKNSDTLLTDLKKYLNSYIGFGDFIFRDRAGQTIAVAHTLKEFEKHLKVIPDESFYLHAIQNQYSIWLMARGEITLAKTINPIRIESLENISKTRVELLKIIKDYQAEKKKGKVIRFEDDIKFTEKNIVTLANGSLGGKGRGLAFINTLIYNFDLSEVTSEINIRTPKTAIIGTKEFDIFMSKNKIYEKVITKGCNFNEIKQAFLNGDLTPEIELRLTSFLEQVNKPIAVRSSSLSEDSFTQPFAGVFHTYILPNNREQKELSLQKLKDVVKLVFASIFSDEARGYYNSIHHRMEDEKMAVILQELVGNHYGDYYYPHISGTACSYNYYPVAHMEPEEGFAMAALGLGSYVVDGMSSFRFSPKYPNVDMYSNKDLINSSQVKFYALNSTKGGMDYAQDGELASLELLDINIAEEHGSLKHCVSVYDMQNDRVVPGLSASGPRIVNFANILKYNYAPLAKTLEILLNTIKEALGSPTEIEFAVDLNKAENGLPTFYLLQTKPMVDSRSSIKFNIDQFNKSDALLYTETSLGNGKIDDICDIIYVEKQTFDKMKTLEMVNEIEYLNRLMLEENRPYILIGPGRWGTRDQFLGIPVNWSQISNAKIIVEISLDNFPLDASLGSHFFHNITSMNIGYFSVNNQKNMEFINWDRLYKEDVINKTKYFRHIRFKNPVTVLMDGKEKKSIIVESL